MGRRIQPSDHRRSSQLILSGHAEGLGSGSRRAACLHRPGMEGLQCICRQLGSRLHDLTRHCCLQAQVAARSSIDDFVSVNSDGDFVAGCSTFLFSGWSQCASLLSAATAKASQCSSPAEGSSCLQVGSHRVWGRRTLPIRLCAAAQHNCEPGEVHCRACSTCMYVECSPQQTSTRTCARSLRQLLQCLIRL